MDTRDGENGLLVLVKHAEPVLDASVPAREWALSRVGEGQAVRLAERLRPYLPFRLVTSVERKAHRTGEIIAATLGLPVSAVDGVHEIDRRALPVVDRRTYEAMNAPIFTDVDRPVLGGESARDALERFGAAVHREASRAPHEHLVIVTHGTVISLLCAAHDDLDAFTLWKELDCASFVVLTSPALAVVEAPGALEPSRTAS